MKRFMLPILLLLLFTPLAQAEKPFFEEPILFGLHRGGAEWQPESTVETYKAAKEKWPHALLEMDLRLTKDGAVVVCHDATIDRTTNGTGAVAELTLEELKALDAGYTFTTDDGATYPYRAKGLQIATLDEVLTALPEAHWLIEPKSDDGVVAAMAKILKKHDAVDKVLIAAFKPQLIEETKQLLPGVATCYTTKTGFNLLTALRTGGEAWEKYEPEDDVLSLMRRMVKQYQLTPEEFKKMQAKGIRIQLHTLDTEVELKAALDMGIDSILTDRPDVFEKVLENR